MRAGLIFRLDGAYAFLHDRVREAAYALIPEAERPAAHLRIGRVLASRTAPVEFEEKIFEIVNQLDRGAALIHSPEERERVAELHLVAGKRAKTSTAYASALTYFAVGRTLLAEDMCGGRPPSRATVTRGTSVPCPRQRSRAVHEAVMEALSKHVGGGDTTMLMVPPGSSTPPGGVPRYMGTCRQPAVISTA